MALMPPNLEGSLVTAVRGYASSVVVACLPDRITGVSRFEDGNRHGVYRVSYIDATGAAADLVVRVSYGGDAGECAQAEQEARVLKKVGGVAAPLQYDFSCTSPWFETPAMCMEFVPGHQLELASAGPAEIGRLGSVVGWVHELPVDDLADSFATNDTIASYAEGRMQSILSTLAWARHPLPAPIQARLKDAAGMLERSWEAQREAESFKTDETLALLHGDIGPGNILWGPDPVLIDWEYARLGDAADEIAYTFDQNGLAASQRDAFWRGYRESISSHLRRNHVAQRATWWEPVTLFGSTLWWVERWVRRTEADAVGRLDPAAPRQPDYYFGHVISRLDRLDNLLAQQP